MRPSHYPQPGASLDGLGVYKELTLAQSFGRECLVCGARTVDDADRPLPDTAPVGVDYGTRRYVRACTDGRPGRRCAQMLGWVDPSKAGEQLALPLP